MTPFLPDIGFHRLSRALRILTKNRFNDQWSNQAKLAFQSIETFFIEAKMNRKGVKRKKKHGFT